MKEAHRGPALPAVGLPAAPFLPHSGGRPCRCSRLSCAGSATSLRGMKCSFSRVQPSGCCISFWTINLMTVRAKSGPVRSAACCGGQMHAKTKQGEKQRTAYSCSSTSMCMTLRTEVHRALACEKVGSFVRCMCSCVHDRRAVGAVRRCRGRQEDLLGQAAARAVLEILHHFTSALGHHLAASAAPSPARRSRLGTRNHGPQCTSNGKCNGPVRWGLLGSRVESPYRCATAK